ncbi:hypothetical protein G6F59_014531 [Rhizopus arrhizus]|nr:hypothetical protein G6F59_014531 [Rhizopus arrhizus]
MLTGFHGAHVLLGTIMLIVIRRVVLALRRRGVADAVPVRLRALTTRGSVGSATEAVRVDPAHVDAHDHQYDQGHRHRDAAGQCVDRALGLAAVDQQVIQAGAQIPDDDDQKRDYQQGLQRITHARLEGRVDAPI